MKKISSLAAMMAVTTMLAAACGGSKGAGVATAPSTKGAAPAGSAVPTAKADPIAYSKCMRSHGVPDFPDPDAQGRIKLTFKQGANGEKSGTDPNSPQFKTAQQACHALQPAPDAGQQQSSRNAVLKYSTCMRDHGIKDFPDPNPDGSFRIQMKPGTDMDPNAPVFKAAQQACKQYSPMQETNP